MSIASDPTTERLIAALYEVDGKSEIVDGRVVLMSPPGYHSGRAGGAIYISLRAYENKAHGVAFPDNFRFPTDLPNRNSFCPDAAW